MTREERQAEREAQVSRGERFWDMVDLSYSLSVNVVIGLLRAKMKMPPTSTSAEVFHARYCAYYGANSCNGKDFEEEVRKAFAEKEVPFYVGRPLLVDPEPV